MKKLTGILLSLILMLSLSACGTAETASEPPSATPSATPSAETSSSADSSASEPPVSEGSYIDRVVAETIAKFAEPGMGEYEKAKAAFDYLIETTYFEKPIALDVWRFRGGGEIPSYVENKSLSVLLFGLGECEDYAAALTMLLRGMGIEAEYVPGLTYSVEGALVDHAWTVAKIDGVWYHLDSQLQDNISKNSSISYRYFMKGDATMISSHRWGQNLIDSGLLTWEQNAELAENFLYPPCPQDYPTPARKEYTPTPHADATAMLAEIGEERQAYENLHGPLEPLELHTTPPVFAWNGFGPPD